MTVAGLAEKRAERSQDDIDADGFRYEHDDDDDPERWGTCGHCGAAIDVKDDLADGCWYCGEDL